MKYLEGDDELFVHVRLSKRTFELTASDWKQISVMLQLRFLLAVTNSDLANLFSHD